MYSYMYVSIKGWSGGRAEWLPCKGPVAEWLTFDGTSSISVSSGNKSIETGRSRNSQLKDT